MWQTKAGFNQFNQFYTFNTRTPLTKSEINVKASKHSDSKLQTSINDKSILKDESKIFQKKNSASRFRFKVIERRSDFERRTFLDKQMIQDNYVIEEKANNFMSNTTLPQMHENIMKSFKVLSQDIINSLNLNHFQLEMAIQTPESQKDITKNNLQIELQYELINAIQNIEQEIIQKLFKENQFEKVQQYQFTNKDTIGKDFKKQKEPYDRFNIKMLLILIQNLVEPVGKFIKFLFLVNPITAQIFENVWKTLLLLLDLSIKFAYDRNNQQIQDAIKFTQEELKMAQKQGSILEERQIKLIKDHEKELAEERTRFYHIKEDYELIHSQYQDLLKSQTDDVKHIANGGLHQMKRNVPKQKFIVQIYDVGETLKTIEKEVINSSESMFNSLKCVATTVINKNKQEKAAVQIRQLFGINIMQQTPGDLAFGNMASEHPWIPILLQKNITVSFSKMKEKQLKSKSQTLHEFLLVPSRINYCPLQIFLQDRDQYQFSDVVLEVFQIIQNENEQTKVAQHSKQILDRIFNLFGKEGLDFQQFYLLQQFYVNLLEVIQQSEMNGASSPLKMGSDYLIYNSSLFNRRVSGEQISKALLNIKKYIELDKEFNLLQQEMHDLKENGAQFSLVLYQMCEALYKIGLYKFEIRVKELQTKLSLLRDQENFIKKSVAESIMNGVFPEYDWIDGNKMWNYLIWRYYVIFDRQIKYDLEITEFPESSEQRQNFLGSGISTDNIINQFMVETVKKIKTLLIFNSKCFGDITKVKLNDSIESDGSQSRSRIKSSIKITKQVSGPQQILPPSKILNKQNTIQQSMALTRRISQKI